MSRSLQSSASRPENKALVVALSVLQLSAIGVVWLLAIVPAGLLALLVLAWRAASAVLRAPRA